MQLREVTPGTISVHVALQEIQRTAAY